MKTCFCIVALLLFAFPRVSEAATLIRDAEIEGTVREIGDPIFREAGLDPEGVKLFIIQDTPINAFVAGGSNIFITTGLLGAAKSPEALAGVLAHETGHIAGGHLAKGAENLKNQETAMVLGTILGGIAAAAGSKDAGMAILSATPQMAMRSFLAFSRDQEHIADESALRYLNALHLTPKGMLDLFETLRLQEQLHVGQLNPYLQTHPLTSDRIARMREATSAGADTGLGADVHRQFERLQLKLFAFLELPAEVLRQYPPSDTSEKARYARAIAYFRSSEKIKALAEIDPLLAAHPKDPYLHELKGQILLESGDPASALASYREALKLRPSEPMIELSHATALLALDDPKSMDKAISALESAVSRDPTLADGWMRLGIAYGRKGDQGRADLALAEEALLRRKPDEVLRFARRAEKSLTEGSPSRLRVADLTRLAETMKKEQKK